MKIRLKRNPFRAFRNNEGGTALEMAFVLPALMMLIMGIIEFGIVLHLQSLMTYASDEAARMGKTGYNYNYEGTREELALKTIRTRMAHWIREDKDLTVTETSYGSFNDLRSSRPGVVGTGSGGEIVVYTVTLNWRILTPFVAQIMGGVAPITARVLIKNECFSGPSCS